MTANRLPSHGKRAFLALLALAGCLHAAELPDPGWRLTVIPSFERPALHEIIPTAPTAVLAVARHVGYDEFEYATTRGAWRLARELAARHGGDWLDAADVAIRRDPSGVIDRILITGSDPLLPSIALSPVFYEHFEPLLGAGFYVIIPDRNTLALYPRVAGEIPARDSAALLERHRLATYPVSREVFGARRGGLVGAGVLEE